MTYGAECSVVRKGDENRLHIAEMRMLRCIRGKPRKNHVRNQVIQEDANIGQMSTFMRQKRLNWHGAHQEKRRRQPLTLKKKNDGHGCIGEEKGAA